MLAKVLAPGVENQGDAGGCAEVLGVGGEGLQGVCGGLEQTVVDDSGVALCQRVDVVR